MASSDLFLFVSHVAENRVSAMEIVDELERRGTRCWIAPRDVRPGEPFDDEIADAIEASRAMLLIFSELCNDSQYIRREVTVAGESHKIVIPFRIEDVLPRRGLRVRLSDLHWIDGFTSRERAIDEVIKKFAPAANGSPRGNPAAPALRDDGEQEMPTVQAEPKAADTITQAPQIMTGTAGAAAEEQITTQATPELVGTQDDHRDTEGTAAPRDPERRDTTSLSDASHHDDKLHKAETRKEKAEPVPPATVAPSARAPLNITSLQVVCALLILQGIGRAGFGIAILSLAPHKETIPLGVVLSVLIVFGSAAAVPVIIAFGITRLKRWARVFGLIAAGIGAIFGGGFAIEGLSDLARMNVTIWLLILSVVIDVVVIIYLIRGYRPVPRAA